MPTQPELIENQPGRLIGMSSEMTRAQDQTAQLWRRFMPRRAEVTDRTSPDLISLQIYPQGPGQIADPQATFTKWAGAEVTADAAVPADMQSLDLPGGLYAVFEHQGPANDLSTVMYIFGEWLPASSEYALDDRPHFERLPPGYSPMDPDAREEFWIPVRRK